MTYDVNTEKVSGAHVIRAFLLDRVTNVLGWTKVNNLDPIAPLQQQPEFTNADKPFIIYTYSTTPYGVMWERCVENIGMSVYSDNEQEVRQTISYLVTLMKRADWSAADVNNFISASTNPLLKPFDFKTITVTASASDGGSQEGGRLSGYVGIRAEYTHERDNDIVSMF